MAAMELFKRKQQSRPVEQGIYETIMGEKMDVESLLIIRELEDFWIDGRVITEADREPVPDYLREEWIAAVGPMEERRIRDTEEDAFLN
jgi:hypothetical protein